MEKSFKGCVDGIAGGVLFGWAVDPADPMTPVELEILVGSTVVGKVAADLPRPDISYAASVGGRCGFIFDLSSYLGNMDSKTVIVRAVLTGRLLSNSPLEVTERGGWGSLDYLRGIVAYGWAVVANPAQPYAVVEILVDGKSVGTSTANLDRPDLRLAGLPRFKCGFEFTIPHSMHDGQSHTVTARIAGSGRHLVGGEKSFRAMIKSHVDHFSLEQVSGWIVNAYASDVPVKLDLYVDKSLVATTETSRSRTDVASKLGLNGVTANFGFDIALPRPKEDWKIRRLKLCFSGTTDAIGGEEHVLFRRDFVLHAVENIASILFALPQADGSGLESDMSLIRQHFFPYLIDQVRYGPPEIHIIAKPPADVLEMQAGEQEPVDVIVPVYKGFRETIECIRSVLTAQTEKDFELIILNDCSPDAALTAELRALAAESRFTLLENQHNLGFVATVNRGMKLHPYRDVVLLNSDTVVPKGWLEGLRRAAYSAPGIGTVTPFSNRATICSLPRTCFDNEMPLGASAEDLNGLCAQVNPGVVVDIPTAIGFAMYIRRETLNEVGYFDEEKWDKGYGEENEFCIRASNRGWRHVAACDVFVQHHGSVSFDTGKSPRLQQNLAKLNKFYPDYAGKIQRFIKADPLAGPRGRVVVGLMKRLAARYVLFITHGLGGGTETAIRDLCAMKKKEGIALLILRSTPSGTLEFAPAIGEHEKTLKMEYPHDLSVQLLAEQLRELPIESVQFHHTLGFGADIWQLPKMLKVPYDVMIHDFYLVCPRINLIDDTGWYCGQPDITVCERCIKANALDHDIDERLEEVGGTVARWRGFHGLQLRNARHVLAPSEDTKRRINTYLPTQAIEVVPHPESEFTFKQREWDGSLPYRVAVLGAIGQPKGSDLLLACAKYAERRGLPIKFVVIGYTCCDNVFTKLTNVEITGRYKPEELEGIVREIGCTVALFLSVWPETFSYTLSEAWRLGLHPITLDIGAPADRIRERQIGTVASFSQDPKTIVATLLGVLDNQKPG